MRKRFRRWRWRVVQNYKELRLLPGRVRSRQRLDEMGQEVLHVYCSVSRELLQAGDADKVTRDVGNSVRERAERAVRDRMEVWQS